MTEKVIFEFRTRQDEKGMRYEIKYPADGIAVHAPAWKDFYPSFLPCSSSKREIKRACRLRLRSRWQMRKTLDFYERMYEDLYGEEQPQ
ncbi:MAG: hypothetical protein U9R58_15905 [Chloroflexota bacterium]|nr:hypothetical protein [Chloroflexota bacterium]